MAVQDHLFCSTVTIATLVTRMPGCQDYVLFVSIIVIQSFNARFSWIHDLFLGSRHPYSIRPSSIGHLHTIRSASNRKITFNDHHCTYKLHKVQLWMTSLPVLSLFVTSKSHQSLHNSPNWEAHRKQDSHIPFKIIRLTMEQNHGNKENNNGNKVKPLG